MPANLGKADLTELFSLIIWLSSSLDYSKNIVILIPLWVVFILLDRFLLNGKTSFILSLQKGKQKNSCLASSYCAIKFAYALCLRGCICSSYCWEEGSQWYRSWWFQSMLPLICGFLFLALFKRCQWAKTGAGEAAGNMASTGIWKPRRSKSPVLS